MKILHIITGLNDGGAEATLTRLCVTDVANEHIVVSLIDQGKYGYEIKELGRKVHCLNMKQGRLSITSCRKLFSIIKNENPDIVQTWMYHADLIGGIIARMAGVKHVFWGIHHSVLEFGKAKFSTIIVAYLCAMLSRFIPCKIICCANKSVNSHQKIGYDRSKMLVINNGYDFSKFKPTDKTTNFLRQELIANRDTFILGMVARFHPFKNHDGLFKAISKLKEESDFKFKLCLVGTGINKENPDLINLINKYNISQDVVLFGQRTDIPELMSLFDVHLLTSTSEAFPNVLCEAMACGTPCISTNVGDAKHILGKHGWIVPINNPERFRDAIQEAYRIWKKSRHDWDKMKLNVRQHVVENFDITKMVMAYNSAWSFHSYKR